MESTRDPQLGKALAAFPKATVYERGLVAQQWGREVALPWAVLTSIYYYSAQDTITLLLVPVAQINQRKLTLTAEDGAKVVLGGSSTDEIYGFAVAATQERRLARAIDQLEAGKTVPFGPLLVSREALNASGFARAVGLFPTIPWSTVAGVKLEEGWVKLSRRNPKRPDAAPGDSKPIARAWGVGNADVFEMVAIALSNLNPAILKNSCLGCGRPIFMFARFCRHCWRRVSREEFLNQLPQSIQEQYRKRDALFPAEVACPPEQLPAKSSQTETAPATEARKGKGGSTNSASASGPEWPRCCVIEKACRDKAVAVALSRRLSKFKSVIEAVRVSRHTDGVLMKVSTKLIPRDVYDSIREELAG
jgi:hypothetical protein